MFLLMPCKGQIFKRSKRNCSSLAHVALRVGTNPAAEAANHPALADACPQDRVRGALGGLAYTSSETGQGQAVSKGPCAQTGPNVLLTPATLSPQLATGPQMWLVS